MNPLVAATVIALLLLIRFAIPCAVVGGLCYTLDRLMTRWEAEARPIKKGIATD